MVSLKNIKKSGSIDLVSKNPLRTVTKARLVRSIIQDDYVDVTVESVEPINFSLEDKIEIENRDYFLNLNPKATKNSSRNFVYDLRYEGVSYLLRKIKLFNRDNQGRETDFNFALTTDLEGFLSVILNNANHKSNDWVLGSIPSNTDTKTLSFNNQNCLSALQDICSEYSVEFDFVKVSGKYQLNIGDLGNELDFTFEYGKGKGLYSLTRQSVADTEVVTRLYGFGGSQNLPIGYRDYSQKLRMPESFGDYVEDQELINLFGFVEDIHQSDIKPEFNGKVTTVGVLGNGVKKFTSNDMDFDLKETDGNGTKYLLDGQPAIIHFNTGRLAGYEFDVHDYNHSTKEFQIIQYTDDRGLTIPDNNAFRVESGDEFTILNIQMPQSYVTDAENRLKTEIENKYQEISRNNIKYVLNTDPLFMRSKSIQLGDVAPIKDNDLDVDKEIRIVKIEYDLLAEKYSLDLSDTYEVSLVKEIMNEIHKVNKNINRNRADSRRTYMQGYKRLKELQNSIFDPDGYFDTENIKPGSIETGMISVGAQSQRLNLEDVVFTPNYQGNANAVNVSSGTLVHFTIDTSIRTWNMSSKTQTGLAANSTYYIYARCSRSGSTGTWHITTDKIQFDEDGNYWHFLVALLYKPQENVRLIDLLYGATFIQGGQIQTGRIQSIDGNMWFDLDTGEIHGKVTFTSDSPAKTYVDDAKDAAFDLAKDYIEGLGLTGRNLVIGTGKAKLTSYANGGENNSTYLYNLDFELIRGKYISLSFDWEYVGSSPGGTFRIQGDGPLYNFGNVGNLTTAITSSETSGHYVLSFTASSSNLTFSRIGIRLDDVVGQVKISNLKVEYGEPTPWNTAIDDISQEAYDLAKDYVDGKIADIGTGGNLFSITDLTTDFYPNSGGNIQEGGANTYYVAVIEVDDSKIYSLSCQQRLASNRLLWAFTRVYPKNGTTHYGYINHSSNNDTKFEGISPPAQCKYWVIEVSVNESLQAVKNARYQVEEGSTSTPFKPSLIDLSVMIEDAQQNLQALETLQEKTNYLQTTANGGVVATGTLAVGNNASKDNAGITGQGSAFDAVRFWAGKKYSGRATAPWVILDNGMELQFDGLGRLIRRRGVLPNGDYVDEFYNPVDGLLAKRTGIIGGYITDEWYNNGSLVYQIGRNGIYYVKEVPESWTAESFRSLGTNSDNTALQNVIRANACYMSSGGSYDYNWRNTNYTTVYLYSAGQNPNSQNNKQYEGYKKTNNSKTNNIDNGWYCRPSSLGRNFSTGNVVCAVFRVSGGVIQESKTLDFGRGSMIPCTI